LKRNETIAWTTPILGGKTKESRMYVKKKGPELSRKLPGASSRRTTMRPLRRPEKREPLKEAVKIRKKNFICGGGVSTSLPTVNQSKKKERKYLYKLQERKMGVLLVGTIQ